jgi:hypothetical protein
MAVHSRFDSRNHAGCETFVDEIYLFPRLDPWHSLITLISDLHHDSSLRPFSFPCPSRIFFDASLTRLHPKLHHCSS